MLVAAASVASLPILMAGASPAASSSDGSGGPKAWPYPVSGCDRVTVTRLTFTMHTGPKHGLTQSFWVNRKEPLKKFMLLMLDWGEVSPATTCFLHGGGLAGPTRGTEVYGADTADSLLMAFDDYIDIVGLAMLPVHGRGKPRGPDEGLQPVPRQLLPAMETVKRKLESPSRSPPRTHRRLGFFGSPPPRGDRWGRGRLQPPSLHSARPSRRRRTPSPSPPLHEETQDDSPTDDEKFHTSSSS